MEITYAWLRVLGKVLMVSMHNDLLIILVHPGFLNENTLLWNTYFFHTVQFPILQQLLEILDTVDRMLASPMDPHTKTLPQGLILALATIVEEHHMRRIPLVTR